jgi:hypothetical protein
MVLFSLHTVHIYFGSLKIVLFISDHTKRKNMNNLFRGLIAGYGAYKLGGGCLGTIVVFLLIWWALGHC